MNIKDETEVTRIVVCNQRAYEVPVDVADRLDAQAKEIERLKGIVEKLRNLPDWMRSSASYVFVDPSKTCEYIQQAIDYCYSWLTNQLTDTEAANQSQYKTKDGVAVSSLDTELWYIANDGNIYQHTPWGYSDIPTMYSTRAAAAAAKGEA